MAQRAEHGAQAGEASRGEALLAQIVALDAQATALAAQQTAANDRLKLEDALRQPLTDSDAAALGAAVPDMQQDPHK